MSNYKSKWFDVDAEGLAKLLERRGKAWLIYELVQNSLDAGATQISIELDPVEGSPQVELTVTDDVPDGWRNITHAWTLFAESEKKGDPTKAGKFNLGEKLVLALCSEATIVTTTAAVCFDRRGRTMLRSRRERGSQFYGIVRMTRAELEDVRAACRLILISPADGCTITINGDALPVRKLVATTEAILPTEIADAEGVLRPTSRKARIDIFEPLGDEPPFIYELGLPVVETEDRYHVRVFQRVPVSLERDNVPPSYLRRLRAVVLNETASKLSTEELARSWVTEATTDTRIEPEAVKAVVTARFGAGAVSYDPSDKGSNAKALSHGVQVVHGGSLPRETWEHIREHGLIKPAGQIYPDAPKSFLSCPQVEPLGDELTIMRWFGTWGKILLGREIKVRLIDEARIGELASWDKKSTTLTLNRAHLGESFFARGEITEAVIALLIHELAHDFDVGDGDDHMSAAYYEACCTIGARLALKLMAGKS